MRRILYLLGIFLLPLCCKSQDVREYIKVMTDRELYITGEKLYVSVRIENEKQQPLDMSRVAYVELCDTKKAHAQFMIALEDGCGWGEITLPPTMHSGTYELSVYTRYMLNFAPSCFFRKHLGVVNLASKSPEDQLIWEETAPEISSGKASVHTDKSVYAQRSKVQVHLPEDYQGQAAISVRKMDMANLSAESAVQKQTYEGKPDGRYLPELEDHLLSVRESDVSSPLSQVRLGVMGLTTRVADGYLSKDNSFLIFVNGMYGHQHIALDGYDAAGHEVPVTVNSPYAQSLPSELPVLKIGFQELPLQYRLLSSKLKEYVHSQRDYSQDFTVAGREPSYVYNLSEYTPMQSIREALTEFVEGIKSDKHNGQHALFTTYEESIGYSRQPALVLLDGVPVQDIEKLLDYDARKIHYILIYRGKYTFGNTVQEGVISFTTYTGDLPNFVLPENERLYEYDFPQDHPSFLAVEYPDDKSAASVQPDFRSLLYWNPQVRGNAVSFYTSDMAGVYEIQLTTFNALGEIESYTGYFEVKP